jgi:ribonuclease P protein component
MKEAYGPQERIRNKQDFLFLFKEGKRHKDKYFNLIYSPNSLSFSRMAVIVSKEVGNAVFRNKMKRWMRDLFRRNKEYLKHNLDILIIIKKDIQETSWTNLRENYLQAVKSIGEEQF